MKEGLHRAVDLLVWQTWLKTTAAVKIYNKALSVLSVLFASSGHEQASVSMSVLNNRLKTPHRSFEREKYSAVF